MMLLLGRDANELNLFSVCKVVRILRLERIISVMAASDDVKLTLRLFKLVAIIVIFIHLTTCLFFFYVK